MAVTPEPAPPPAGPWVPPPHLFRPGLVISHEIPTAAGLGAEVSGNARYLMGWSVANTSAAAVASFIIYDNTTAAGFAVHPVNLAPNESNREWFGPDGQWFAVGMFFEVTAGTVLGSVQVADAVLREAAAGADF